MRLRVTQLAFAAAAAAAVCLGSCRAHGEYTSAARDEARSSIDAIHAGTDYDEAMRRYRSGDFDGAIESLDESLRLSPSVPKSHLLKARIFVEMGRLGDALRATDEGLAALDELDPRGAAAQAQPRPSAAIVVGDVGSTEFHYLRGVIHEQQGLFEGACASYKRVLEVDAEDAGARLALAEVHVQLGNLAKAKELLASSSGWSDGEAGFRQALGHIALLEGDAAAALRMFEEAAILSPRDPSILEDLFRSRAELGRFDEALTAVEALSGQLYYTARPDLQRLHALCHIQVREPLEARAILRELTESEGGARDFESWRLLADVAVMLEDDRLLRASADRMVQAAPMRSEGFLVQAISRRREGDVEGALASARLAVERSVEGDATAARLERLLQEERKGRTPGSSGG